MTSTSMYTPNWKRHINLLVIDNNIWRRRTIGNFVLAPGINIEQCQDRYQIINHHLRAGILLVHDEDGSVLKLNSYMQRSEFWLPVIGFSEQPSTQMVVKAMLDGAMSYIAWPFSADELTETSVQTQANVDVFGAARRREIAARRRIEPLTSREKEVLIAMASGMSNRKIGEELAISPRTVEVHRKNLLNKMKTSHTSEAIRLAIDASLV
jgi:two-component system response regulator FixJ